VFPSRLDIRHRICRDVSAQDSHPAGSPASWCGLSETPWLGGSWLEGMRSCTEVSGSREQIAQLLYWAMLLGGLTCRLQQRAHLALCFAARRPDGVICNRLRSLCRCRQSRRLRTLCIGMTFCWT